MKNLRIFEIALERSACLPENAVMVGDRIAAEWYLKVQFVGLEITITN